MSSVEELDQTQASVPTEALDTSLSTKATDKEATNDDKMDALSQDVKSEVDLSIATTSSEGGGFFTFIFSLVKKIVVVGTIYMVGYMGWSVGWLAAPIILSIIRDHHRSILQRKREVAKSFASTDETELILGRLHDLPAWVYFPDVERCEWLNRILKQLWPNANYFGRDLVKNKIEPKIAAALANYKFPGFRFDRIILGTIPPRIGGVKIYDNNVPRDEIIMDVDLFYASDCDINFYLAAMKGGIRDFQISGRIRVVMKPLIKSIPLVGGLQIFFLNNPRVEFDLVGIIDLLDMPGLHELLKRVIISQIGAVMVLPNKLPITLSDEVSVVSLKLPEPEGILRIHVVEGKNLMQMDFGVLTAAKSDPYVIVNVGSQEFKTQIIQNTLDPKWDFWCEAVAYAKFGGAIDFTVKDLDDTGKDEKLGRASVEISNVVRKGLLDSWLVLENAKHGMLHVRLSWHTLSSNRNDLKQALMETQQIRLSSMTTAVLLVFVDSAKNLPQARVDSNPDAYCILSVGKQTEQTASQMRTDSPVWEQGFTFMVANPENDSIHLKIVDSKTEKELGKLSYILNNLLSKKDMKLESQPFQLEKSGPDSNITLTLALKIVKSAEIEEDDITQGKTSRHGPLSHTSSQKSKGDTKSVGGGAGGSNSNPASGSSGSSKQDTKQKNAKDVADVSIPEEEFIMLKKSNISAYPVRVADNLDSVLTHRHSDITSVGGDHSLGRIQLTIRYNVTRQKLSVTVHKIMNIPLTDPSNIPDPYVKLYLLPGRSKDSKRKTVIVKDNCNPVYDATFDYVISTVELFQTDLEVTVCTQKGFLSGGSPIIGMLKIALGEPEISGPGISSWFDLQPEVKND